MDHNFKEHRIGTITLGAGLILFGVLFLVHIFIPALSYQIIFHLWPCLFIVLGVEVLLGTRKDSKSLVFDKFSIILMVILAFFAMGMGVADWCMQQYSAHMYYYW